MPIAAMLLGLHSKSANAESFVICGATGCTKILILLTNTRIYGTFMF